MPRKRCGSVMDPRALTSDHEIAVGAVLYADDGGQARCHLPMRLRFSGACSDGGPGDQVVQVLGHDRIQRFGRERQADSGNVDQEFARAPYTLLDAKRVVEIGVVDEALPADRCSRLFEVGSHHKIQALGGLPGELLEFARILDRGIGVVDRARSDDHEEAMIPAFEDVPHTLPGFQHRGGDFRRGGKVFLHCAGAGQYFMCQHVEVLRLVFRLVFHWRLLHESLAECAKKTPMVAAYRGLVSRGS